MKKGECGVSVGMWCLCGNVVLEKVVMWCLSGNVVFVWECGVGKSGNVAVWCLSGKVVVKGVQCVIDIPGYKGARDSGLSFKKKWEWGLFMSSTTKMITK